MQTITTIGLDIAKLRWIPLPENPTPNVSFGKARALQKINPRQVYLPSVIGSYGEN